MIIHIGRKELELTAECNMDRDILSHLQQSIQDSGKNDKYDKRSCCLTGKVNINDKLTIVID